MKLYHSSPVSVTHPDTIHSRDFLDFGKGFYLTSIHEQAVKYAQRFIRRNREAWLNSYEFVYNPSEWKILRFDAYDREWLRFVAGCRAGKDNTDFDMVVGGIANDRVIQTLDRFFEGEISEDETLGLLKYEKPNIQYCIRSQQMLDVCLEHVESQKL